MGKIPPQKRKSAGNSLRKIAEELGIPYGKGRPVKPATCGQLPLTERTTHD